MVEKPSTAGCSRPCRPGPGDIKMARSGVRAPAIFGESGI